MFDGEQPRYGGGDGDGEFFCTVSYLFCLLQMERIWNNNGIGIGNKDKDYSKNSWRTMSPMTVNKAVILTADENAPSLQMTLVVHLLHFSPLHVRT